AVVGRDEGCWRELYAMLHDQVLTWCRLAGIGPRHDAEEMVTMTWEKVWRSYGPEQLAAATGGGSVLRYPQMCAFSVVMDQGRQMASRDIAGSVDVDLVDDGPASDDLALSSLERGELWDIINGCLRDDRERTLMHLRYELEVRSAEVQRLRPD